MDTRDADGLESRFSLATLVLTDAGASEMGTVKAILPTFPSRGGPFPRPLFSRRNDRPVTPLKPGDMIEGYKVLSELGRGAASIIYLVQDPKTKQIWALKEVGKEDAKDDRFLKQTEQEYEIAVKLQHPNIRRIDKLIKKKDGLLSVSAIGIVLVMELIDGEPLDKAPPRTFETGSTRLRAGGAGDGVHARQGVRACRHEAQQRDRDGRR